MQRRQRKGPSAENTASEVLAQKALSGDSLEKAVGEREARMIRAILKMEDTTAREIMIPRVDILSAEVNTPLLGLAELMIEGGHSRIPIYSETMDNIVGIVYARDVLRFLGGKDEAPDLRKVVRPALFIPESKRLEGLLLELQERRMTIAIVVDEYGGVAGLVTMEDLLEEIVGDIEDEFGSGEPEVELIGENEALVSASISIEHLNELFSASLSGDGFDTLGGLVYKQLGKMPAPGDRVTYNDISMEVVSTIGRRIRKVRVVKTPPSSEPLK